MLQKVCFIIGKYKSKEDHDTSQIYVFNLWVLGLSKFLKKERKKERDW